MIVKTVSQLSWTGYLLVLAPLLNLKVPGRDGDPTGRGDQEWPEGRVQDEMQ